MNVKNDFFSQFCADSDGKIRFEFQKMIFHIHDHGHVLIHGTVTKELLYLYF